MTLLIKQELGNMEYINLKQLFKKNTIITQQLQQALKAPMTTVEEFAEYNQKQDDLTNLMEQQKDIAAEILKHEKRQAETKALKQAAREKEAEEALKQMYEQMPEFCEMVQVAFDGIASELQSMIEKSHKLQATGNAFDARLTEHQLRLAVKNQFTKSFGVHQSNLYGPNVITETIVEFYNKLKGGE